MTDLIICALAGLFLGAFLWALLMLLNLRLTHRRCSSQPLRGLWEEEPMPGRWD